MSAHRRELLETRLFRTCLILGMVFIAYCGLMPKDRLVHGLPTDFFGRLETPCPYWAIFLLSPGPYWAGIGWCLFDRIAFLSTLVLMTAWGISRARRRSRRLEHAIAAVMLSHWPHPTEPAPLLLNSGE